MNLTKLFFGSLLLTTSLNAEPLDQVVREGRLSLREVIRAVAERNPSVKAAEAKWETMKARVPQAAAWEDLRAGVDSFVERSVSIPANSFMNQTAMLEQEVPISGKNRSRARAATAEAGAAFEDLRRMELDVSSRARIAYARLANGYAQLEVNRRNDELLGQFVQISRSRYETGAATQADVLIAQTDAAKLLETRADIERQISEAQSALNVLLNRPAQAPLGRPGPLVFTPRVAFVGKTASHRHRVPARVAASAKPGRRGQIPGRAGEPAVVSRSGAERQSAAVQRGGSSDQ